jgi:hypothetical protein
MTEQKVLFTYAAYEGYFKTDFKSMEPNLNKGNQN